MQIKLDKATFNSFDINKQVKYFNEELEKGFTILEVCNKINISYNTIRDRFLRNNYIYNKTTKKGLISHFRNIANSVSLPIILYNVPSRTSMNILPETVLELSKIDNIVGIKEASGNISQVAKIASLCGDDFAIYSGNDDQICPILSLGGKGVISVLSNVAPKLTCSITNSFFKKATDEACFYQLQALPLIEALFAETNPIPIKSAISMIGFDFGVPRLPLVECSANLKNKIRQIYDTTK